MSNMKKLLATLVAALLVLTLVPVSALAAGPVTIYIYAAIPDGNGGYLYGDAAAHAMQNGKTSTTDVTTTWNASTSMSNWTIKSYSQLGFVPKSGWKYKGTFKYNFGSFFDAKTWKTGETTGIVNNSTRTLYYYFENPAPATYPLTVETLVNGEKVGSGTGGGSYISGKSISIAPASFTKDPAYDYTFAGWTISNGSGTFTNAKSENTSFKTGNAATTCLLYTSPSPRD